MASSLFPDQNRKQQTLNNALNEVKQMINGRDPQQVFYEECKRRGIDANAILSVARMFK